MDKNPDWDSFWACDFSMHSILEKLHHLINFHSYKKILDNLKIKNPDVIELGCGTGELSARIMERYGGTATLVDNSDAAMKLASANFARHKLQSDFLKTNIFNLKSKKKYDIVHSEGLIEHFTGREQKNIIEAHRQCVSKKGFVLISVPRKTWYYNIWRKLAEKTGKWPFGDEKTMDADALKRLLEQNRLSVKMNFNSGRFAFALATIK